jgi:gluconate 2-dehydrogenase gamma chain
LLKPDPHNTARNHPAKQGSVKSDYQGPLSSGLNRRAFLKTSTAIALLGGLTACKPDVPASDELKATVASNPVNTNPVFNSAQRTTLAAVQMQLFPADGNGPSAQDINALDYLEWAMTDAKNIDDGDPEFIIKGIGWLDDLAAQTKGDNFAALTKTNQAAVLQQIAQSNAGENWLSLLMYYLTEALLLDPIYGGNPDGIGWQWLEHQAGFPQPVAGKTYRDFE